MSAQVRTGQVFFGQYRVRLCMFSSGQTMSYQIRSCHKKIMSGQVRSGLVNTDQVKVESGKVMSGLVTSSQVRSDHVRSSHVWSRKNRSVQDRSN